VARELKVQIIGDASSYQRALATSARSTQSFGSGVASGLGKIAKIGAVAAGAAGVGGLIAVLKTGADEFAESSKVAAQTEAVIKSTGGAAGITAKQVDALATSLSQKSGMDDEAIASGENLLLTFTNIQNQAGKGNDIFNQTTAILADMSTALGQDTKSSAIQLGKALNDPVRGVTALQRVGVSFTASQKEQIKSLVESGKTMEAQKLILRELTKEFGGSAEAAGKTLPGQLAKLKNSFEELAGGIVGAMAPALGKAAGLLSGFFQKISKAKGFRAKMEVVWEGVQDAGRGAFDAIRGVLERTDWSKLWKGIRTNAQEFADNLNEELKRVNWSKLGETVGRSLVKALKFAAVVSKNLNDELARAFSNIDWKRVLIGLVKGLKGDRSVGEAIKDLWILSFKFSPFGIAYTLGLKVWGAVGDGIKAAAGSVLDAAANAAKAIVAPLATAWNAIKAATTAAWQGILAALNAVWNAIKAAATAYFDGLKAYFGAVLGFYRTIFTTAWEGIRAAVAAVWNAIRAAATAVFDGLKTYFTTLLNFYRTIFTTAWAGIQTALTAVWNAIRTAAVAVFDALKTYFTTVINLYRTIFTTAWEAIKTVTTTAWNGIKTAVTTGIEAITALFRALPGKITSALGSLANLLVGAGGQLIAGLKRGIDSGWHAILGFFSSAKSAIFNALGKVGDLLVGAGWALINGLKKGAESAWNSVKGWLSDRAHEAVHIMTFGLRGSPELFTYYLGKELMTDLVKGMSAGEPAIRSGLGKVADMIIAAAKKFGIDARAALAVAMTEGGLKFGGKAGDAGKSFGPFQMATFGELAGKSTAEARKFADSVEGINYALRKMAEYGAKGATGLEAMRKIIGGPGWGFERPKDPAGELQRAIGYYKQFPEKIAETVSKGAPVVTAAMRDVLNKLGAMVKVASPIIGADNARGIIAGLDANAPNLVARAAAAMQKAIDAQRVVTRQAFVQSFNEMANAAIAAFDARTAAWKPFSQTVLDASQLQAGIKQVEEQLATAMAGVSGAGAAAAADIEKTLGPALGDAMAAAMSQISGAKTEAALQAASQRAQASIFAAITQATAAATAQAQTAVDQARAALAAAQAGGDPEAIAAAQQALDTAVSNQKALEAAIQAEKDAATQRLIVAEQTRHDRIAAIQREGLAKQLATLRAHLLAHPEEWNKMGAAVQRILASYHVRLETSGTTWANKFADGIRAGIPAVRRAAEEMARAAAATIPRSPAKEGPLAFDIVKAGRQWAQGFGKGVKQVDPLFVNGRSLAAAFNAPAAAPAAGGLAVNVYVEGALLGNTVPEVADTIYRELVRKGGRNVSLGLA
jgi:phage-related protein